MSGFCTEISDELIKNQLLGELPAKLFSFALKTITDKCNYAFFFYDIRLAAQFIRPA